jgi:YD repeat-containing protein
MPRRLAALCASVFLASALVACGNDDGDSGVITGPGGGGSNSCRNYETAFSTSTTGPNGATTATSTGTCTISTASLQVTCTTRTTSGGATTTATSIWTYGSTADIVDEVAVVPPRRLALSLVVTSSAAPVTTTTFFYDAADRLTREASLSTTTSYTEWDDRGRPTVGTTVGAVGRTLAISYNDAGRITTTAISSGGQLVTTCRDVFDANGNQISSTCTDGGGATTTTRTISSTQRICK